MAEAAQVHERSNVWVRARGRELLCAGAEIAAYRGALGRGAVSSLVTDASGRAGRYWAVTGCRSAMLLARFRPLAEREGRAGSPSQILTSLLEDVHGGLTSR